MNNDVRICTWDLSDVTSGELCYRRNDPKFLQHRQLRSIFQAQATNDTIFVLQGPSKNLNIILQPGDSFSQIQTYNASVFWNNRRFKCLSQATTPNPDGAHVHLEDTQTGRTIRVASILEPVTDDSSWNEQEWQNNGNSIAQDFNNGKEDLQVIGTRISSPELKTARFDQINNENSFMYSRFTGPTHTTRILSKKGISQPILTTYTLSPTSFKQFTNIFSCLGDLISAISKACQSILSCIRCKKNEVI